MAAKAMNREADRKLMMDKCSLQLLNLQTCYNFTEERTRQVPHDEMLQKAPGTASQWLLQNLSPNLIKLLGLTIYMFVENTGDRGHVKNMEIQSAISKTQNMEALRTMTWVWGVFFQQISGFKKKKRMGML